MEKKANFPRTLQEAIIYFSDLDTWPPRFTLDDKTLDAFAERWGDIGLIVW